MHDKTIIKRRAGIFLLGVGLLMLFTRLGGTVSHSGAVPQDTPIPLTFPTPTETPAPTGSPTRTPTQEGGPQVLVEAIDPDVGANVRSTPEITASNIVGKIMPGNQYVVRGKNFNWYQIEYPEAPNGIAWVYADVVTVIGNVNDIREFEESEIATVDPLVLAIQGTGTAAASTPGGLATLTAQAMITPTGITTADPSTATWIPGQPLPTFTPPGLSLTPPIIQQPVEDSTDTGATLGGVPTLVPILGLTALGVLGLLIALVRRL